MTVIYLCFPLVQVAHRLQQLEVQGDPNLVSEHRAALHQIMLEAKELLKQPLPEGMQVRMNKIDPTLWVTLQDIYLKGVDQH